MPTKQEIDNNFELVKLNPVANLTKEYFDKRLNSLEKGLKSHTEVEVDKLASMTARRFDEIERKLDVKEEVEKLKAQMKQVREALSL